jgi:hypothetical protein
MYVCVLMYVFLCVYVCCRYAFVCVFVVVYCWCAFVCVIVCKRALYMIQYT